MSAQPDAPAPPPAVSARVPPSEQVRAEPSPHDPQAPDDETAPLDRRGLEALLSTPARGLAAAVTDDGDVHHPGGELSPGSGEPVHRWAPTGPLPIVAEGAPTASDRSSPTGPFPLPDMHSTGPMRAIPPLTARPLLLRPRRGPAPGTGEPAAGRRPVPPSVDMEMLASIVVSAGADTVRLPAADGSRTRPSPTASEVHQRGTGTPGPDRPKWSAALDQDWVDRYRLRMPVQMETIAQPAVALLPVRRAPDRVPGPPVTAPTDVLVPLVAPEPVGPAPADPGPLPEPAESAATATGPDLRRRGRVLLGVGGAACITAGLIMLGLALGQPVDVGDVPAADSPTVAAPVVVPVGLQGVVPARVVLPGRGITAPVVPVSTGADGGLTIPDPPTTVGWWTPSALPGGSGGTSVLAGHVDSRVAGLGAFAKLQDMAIGEQVEVVGTDGRTVTYAVVARREYIKAVLPVDDLFGSAGGPPRLVMITCGGAFDRTTRSYDSNVVVYAVPVGGISTASGSPVH